MALMVIGGRGGREVGMLRGTRRKSITFYQRRSRDATDNPLEQSKRTGLPSNKLAASGDAKLVFFVFSYGLHNVCSHIMARSDFFICLYTRVERLSRGLVSYYCTAH